MRLSRIIRLIAAAACTAAVCVQAEGLTGVAKDFRGRLEKNLTNSIIPFWYPKTIDRANGGYLLNHDLNGRLKSGGTKMIVTQSRMIWFFSRLSRAQRGPADSLEAAEVGYRFLKEKMWDRTNGGFYWEVNLAGDTKLRPKKHLYGQAFGLYALSEYYLASGRQEALDLAVELFNLMEAKAHDPVYGGYLEWFNEDWTMPSPGGNTYMGDPDYKLMNTHLHLMEAMTTFYRASRLPLARERLLELIQIQSSAVVRKDLGACTDKYRRDWTPVLGGNYAKVSYGHDLENIWLLEDACVAAGISSYPLRDLYRALFDYSLKYGFDSKDGGFYDSGAFNRPANKRDKIWWVQAEALVASLYLYRQTLEPKYLDAFRKTWNWIEQHQTDSKNDEWFETVLPNGAPDGDKARIWKDGYHNGRAIIECLEILNSPQEK
jgi:cellobiose epimerase